MEYEQTKRIKNENSQINISISEGYCTQRIQIEKGYLPNGELEKVVTLSMWDDMLFSAYFHNRVLYLKDLTEISFEIDLEDQIYFALNRMLVKDISLVVDDDNHQYTFDEYFEILKQQGIYEGENPFLDRANRWLYIQFQKNKVQLKN
ncbi:MAG: hypothetical protein GX951_05290 [Mollicutes bacterium]|nr:hypothetical protein [Mollicutes bacterium]